jgi:hypothetical protein
MVLFGARKKNAKRQPDELAFAVRNDEALIPASAHRCRHPGKAAMTSQSSAAAGPKNS